MRLLPPWRTLARPTYTTRLRLLNIGANLWDIPTQRFPDSLWKRGRTAVYTYSNRAGHRTHGAMASIHLLVLFAIFGLAGSYLPK